MYVYAYRVLWTCWIRNGTEFTDESFVDACLWKAGQEDTFMLNYSAKQQQIPFVWLCFCTSRGEYAFHFCFVFPIPPVFCTSQPIILHTYFSGFISTLCFICTSVHFEASWNAILNLYLKKKRGKTSELILTLCGLSLILKVMNELRTKRIRDSPDFDNHIKRHRAKREGGREGWAEATTPCSAFVKKWRDCEELTAWAVLKEECKIQSDKQDIMTPNVVWALAMDCLTSSQASDYDPVLFSLPAELSKC